jgi:hypothetical protein
MSRTLKTILTGLFLQACFFSTAYASVWWYHGSINDSVHGTGVHYSDGWNNDHQVARAQACEKIPHAEYDGLSTCKIYPDASMTGGYTGLGVNLNSLSCAAGTEPDREGADASNAICAVPVDPCADTLDQTIVATYPQGESSINVGGCLYGSPTAIACWADGTCTSALVGTGVSATSEASGTQSEATNENPEVIEENNPNVSDFSTDTDFVDNGDGTTTETTTDNTTSSNGGGTTTTITGDTITTTNSDGTQTTTTTTTVTTTNADGTQTSTSTTSSSTSAGGGSTSVTNINTGQTTSTSTNPTTTTTTTGTTTSYDADGNVTSMTFTDPISTVEEPTDPNDASDVPSSDNFVNGDFSSLDASIDALKNPFDDSAMVKPTLSISLNTLGTCDNTNYSFALFGSSFAPDVCYWITILQSVLYWVLVALTSVYLFHVATTLGRQS